jgi:hypothetical protein
MVERSTGEAGLPLWVGASRVAADMADVWEDVVLELWDRESDGEEIFAMKLIDHCDNSECVDSVNRGKSPLCSRQRLAVRIKKQYYCGEREAVGVRCDGQAFKEL